MRCCRALRGEALPALELLQSYVVPGLLTSSRSARSRGFLTRVDACREVIQVIW
jgi:hypothetical protein